jgi:tetratricopeptide (TPR) repeat protein
VGRAIALDEKSAWAIAQRGETYRLMGRYDEALADFDRVIALEKEADWVVGSRGEIYRLMGRYDEALADFDRAIALNERDEWNRYLRAQVHYLLHHENAFQQDMEAAIELQKQTRSSSDDIFDCWRWDFNLAVFALFLERDPETQRSFERLIAMCPFLSRLQDALDDLDDLLIVQPQNTLVLPLQQQLRARIQELGQAKVEHM